MYKKLCMAPAAIAERLRALVEEVEAIDLKKEDREGTIRDQFGNIELHGGMEKGCGILAECGQMLEEESLPCFVRCRASLQITRTCDEGPMGLTGEYIRRRDHY